jgi:hypothetical protein
VLGNHLLSCLTLCIQIPLCWTCPLLTLETVPLSCSHDLPLGSHTSTYALTSAMCTEELEYRDWHRDSRCRGKNRAWSQMTGSSVHLVSYYVDDYSRITWSSVWKPVPRCGETKKNTERWRTTECNYVGAYWQKRILGCQQAQVDPRNLDQKDGHTSSKLQYIWSTSKLLTDFRHIPGAEAAQ